MSESEKSSQIGEAVFEILRLQKTVAHLAEKLEKVRKAYIIVSSQMPRLVVDPGNAKRVMLTDPTAEEGTAPEFLLSQVELAGLLREYRFADSALKAARSKLSASGVKKVLEFRQ